MARNPLAAPNRRVNRHKVETPKKGVYRRKPKHKNKGEE